MITRVRVYPTSTDARGQSILRDIQKTFGTTSITKVHTAKIYYFEDLSRDEVDTLARTVLHDPLLESYTLESASCEQTDRCVEIAIKPGVMNPEIATLNASITQIFSKKAGAIYTSNEYFFEGASSSYEIDRICARLLMNETIEYKITSFVPARLTTLPVCEAPAVAIRMLNSEALQKLAHERHLYLSLTELKIIQAYYKELQRDPSDIELETIAQTWSEHCYHKTFKSPFIVNGIEYPSLFSRLKKTAALYSKQVISAFVDNAGVFRFYENFGILGKVETHNSPSAIEPYGGASTGSGGVFRDIMGTGQGAQVIASTDIFCFAPISMQDHEIPHGCLTPRYLLRKVVEGVRDYSNRMGIPTINGSVHFHEGFKAKPSVIVGAYGIAPEQFCYKKKPSPGDYIVLIGGATGRDGIHGATFSSAAMNASTVTTHAQAVQIGNAIEEKRIADLLIAARDVHLIQTLTDCGAGGLSSAIGEMATSCGAIVALDKVPLKYQGLLPWEIWISESQERMICAIEPQHYEEFLRLSALYNVPASHIGHFADSQKLIITYNDAPIADISLEFLHNGIPLPALPATYQKVSLIPCTVAEPANLEPILLQVMGHGNICSKEPIVRQYDQSVQGTAASAPYQGVHQNGPMDAAVLTPLHGKPYGLIISHGLNPTLMQLDVYKGSWWAIVEALSNLVAVGGNIQDACLIDNFIWPRPDTEILRGSLHMALEVCIEAMHLFKIPFISGKDSLSSTYLFPEGERLDIPPVLCISAFSKIPDVARTVSSDVKDVGSCLLLIGKQDLSAMGGSTYLSVVKQDSLNYAVPDVLINDLPHLFLKLHALMNEGIIRACHDVSEGGLIAAVTEMCIGGNRGAHLNLEFLEDRIDFFLFNETAGCFIVEIAPEHTIHPMLQEIPAQLLGMVKEEKKITVQHKNNMVLDIETHALLNASQQTLREIFS